MSLDELGALASAHRRRAGLSRGLRALLLHAGPAQPGWSSGGPAAFRVRRGNGAVAVVAARAARAALRAWHDIAGARARAESLAEDAGLAWRRGRLAEAVAELRRFALAAGRRRRAERRGLLRRSLMALRQVGACGLDAAAGAHDRRWTRWARLRFSLGVDGSRPRKETK